MSVEIEWIADDTAEVDYTDNETEDERGLPIKYAYALDAGALVIVRSRHPLPGRGRPDQKPHHVVHAVYGPAAWFEVRGDRWSGPLPD
ncbi:hypothetical protein ACWF94_12170 [Streptomyces sp. NPDC055078]